MATIKQATAAPVDRRRVALMALGVLAALGVGNLVEEAPDAGDRDQPPLPGHALALEREQQRRGRRAGEPGAFGLDLGHGVRRCPPL